MGFLNRLSTVASPARIKASAIQDYTNAFWGGDPLPDLWLSSLSSAGVNVSPELAMTLSAYYCGVTTIAYDLASLPLRAFKNRPDGGKDLVNASSYAAAGGISSLIYKLQWQPNIRQTAIEFFVSMLAQFELRGKAYAEIVPGSSGFLEQLLPRHPDRVEVEVLPTGRLRYKLREANGQSRYVTQDEMFVVRDLSMDGVDGLSRVAFGSDAIGTALAAERAAGKFFQSGMTAAMMATYTGQMGDEDEDKLHKSISRYAAGVENSFGLMLVPDDVKVSNLAIEPEKAQMMLAREWTVYEVARQLRIQPRKLMAGKTTTYASAYQDSIDHVVNCLRPRAVAFQQAIQRDLVIAKDAYSFVFHLGELLKGDPAQMGEFVQKLIQSRAMTPSEVRTVYLDMNPDDHLDQLSEGDNRPGSSGSMGVGTGGGNKTSPPPAPPGDASAQLLLRACLAVHDNAVRCLRRERAAVEKLAKKHASDPDGWKAGLREFYGEHAAFVAQTMRVPIAIARGYVAEHGSTLEAKGAGVVDGSAGEQWEREEADQLASLAVGITSAA